jgi:putative ABC transport system permease protein
MKSFVRLAGRDLNFESDGLLRVDYRIPGPGYYTPIGVYQGYACFPIVPIIPSTIERIHERLRAVPGAESVGGMSHPPVDNPVVPLMPILVEGQPRPMDEAQRSTSSVRYFLITPSLFSTLRTPLVRGRELTERDTASAPWVAIVNESMARRFWPGEDPVGKRFRLNVLPDEQVREVVGVVRDIPLRLDEVTAEPIVYASYLQQPTRYRVPWANIHGHMVFMVRSSGDPLALVPAVRRAVADVDPSRPVFNIASFGPALGRSVWQRHTYVFVLTVFAIVATLLAVVGLYGVTAFTVAQRTREIGIRVVLGAGAREVVNLVGRRMLAVITLGITIGLGASLLLARLIAQQLWTVTPTDPATFIGVSCLFALVTAGACIVPIRRALAVDPALTLHAE